jgi:hypothetical protein
MTKNELKILGFKYSKKDNVYINKDINDFTYKNNNWDADELEKISVKAFLRKIFNNGYFVAQKDTQETIKRVLGL